MTRRSEALLQFDALAVEGGLLPPEWLAKVAALEAPAQNPAHYGVPKGLDLRDEITRYWRIGEALWAEYAGARAAAKDDGTAATLSFLRQLLPQVFGFSDMGKAGQREAGGRTFRIAFEAAGGRAPVVASTPAESLDAGLRQHGHEGRRRSAWGALQEYLNAEDTVLWGIASNGLRIRIGRDNSSLTRPAWIEADLERLFEDELFADFSVLWLLLHASRFGPAGADPHNCPLQRWRDAAREAGTRAREDLRDGVKEALLELGQGFLSHPRNTALRNALATGELSPPEYFNELLRLVYRMIFLLTIEEREILHGEEVSTETRTLYAEGYGLRRLRERAVRRSQYDRHGDLWDSLKPVFAALGCPGGEAALGLPGLGGLFASGQCSHLDGAVLENRALLTAVFRLAWLRERSGLARVNWKDMGPEELGSVYESLLELVPWIADDARTFRFAPEAESAGNARKLTGSYYTPDSLVQQLLDTALDPVVEQRLAVAPEEQEAALLSISVLDPACGSGHFLLAAARRLAERLVRVRSGDTSVGDEYRRALRDVVTHCIHGVDRNPMALELARMSLWLETYTPERALGFLDHHLVLGDALVGLQDLGVIRVGIPDDAFKALTGDGREVAKTLRKVNRAARKALEKLRESENLTLQLGTQALGEAFAELEALSDDGVADVEAKRRRHDALRKQARESPVALAADLFVGAFLVPKRLAGEEALTEHAAVQRFPQTGTLLMALEGTLGPEHTVAKVSRAACAEARVLHWPLAFPQVFACGGFDVVVGNPPWERIKLQEQEFFAVRAPEIAQARNKAARGKAIGTLEKAPAGSPERRLFDDFTAAKQAAEAVSVFCHSEARYPLTGVGDVNTYALFAETVDQLCASKGRAGIVVPTGIATDDSTKKFFGSVSNGRLISLIDFRTGPGLFSEIGHQRYKFCLLTIGSSEVAEFAFFLTDAAQLRDRRRFFQLTAPDFRLLNPNTLTCPIFRTKKDAELTKKIYRNVPVLTDETKPEEEGNPWGVSFLRMLDMSNDSGLFLDAPSEDSLPLYEAKMIHQFDHRWATYDRPSKGRGKVVSRYVTDEEKADPGFVVQPRYWVPVDEVRRRAAQVPKGLLSVLDMDREDWNAQILGQWLAGHYLNQGDEEGGNHLLGRSTFSDSLVAAIGSWLGAKSFERAYPLDAEDLSIIQKTESAGHTLWQLVERRTPQWLLGWRDICRATDERTVIASVVPLVGVGHTLPLMRSAQGPVALSALLANLCSLPFDFAARQKIGGTHLTYTYLRQLPLLAPEQYSPADLDYVVPRVLELTYTADDLRPWAAALDYSGQPFRWDPDRRARLRAELDAYYTRLYGLTREELAYILDPADVMGPDYPSETFRVLKENEEKQFGEYRTRRLVLEAWDRLTADEEPEARAAAASA